MNEKNAFPIMRPRGLGKSQSLGRDGTLREKGGRMKGGGLYQRVRAQGKSSHLMPAGSLRRSVA